MSKKITAGSNQSLFDLATQLHGSPSKVFDLIDANPSLDNVNSDPTGKEITYEINNTFAQRFFINKGITVGLKPIDYYNVESGVLLAAEGSYLLQENGYKIIM